MLGYNTSVRTETQPLPPKLVDLNPKKYLRINYCSEGAVAESSEILLSFRFYSFRQCTLFRLQSTYFDATITEVNLHMWTNSKDISTLKLFKHK
jgi:hypothetical protein